MLDVFKKSMSSDDKCFSIDTCAYTISDIVQELLSKDALELCLTKGESANEMVEVHEMVAHLETRPEHERVLKVEEIDRDNITCLRPSVEEPLKLKLKQLPSYLEYAFLAGDSRLSVIISSELELSQ